MGKKKNIKSKEYSKENVLKVLDSFTIKKEVKSNDETFLDEIKLKRKTISLPKYVKVSTNIKPNKFSEIGKRVEKGELQWSYYTLENNNGYHYYEIMK